MRFTLKGLLILIAVIACVLGMFRGLTHVERGENVDHVLWLPETAHNISYHRSYTNTCYEFDISEPDFVAWSSWELQSIVQPVEVLRYSFFDRRVPHPSSNATHAEWNEWESNLWATVSDGVFHKHVRDNGGGVTVAYDRTKGRAYFHSCPR